MELKPGHQIIKTRDDYAPVQIQRTAAQTDVAEQFRLLDGVECSWAESAQPLGPEILRQRIEPWLTALVQSEHLSLLIGSGLTHAVHGLATSQALAGMASATFDAFHDDIIAEAERVAKAAERKHGNLEDQIRVANELLRGLEILHIQGSDGDPDGSKTGDLRASLTAELTKFALSILQGERQLASAQDAKRNNAFNYLVNFLMSFASRSGTRERLNIFTTNYDRYIEAGADAAGLRLIDRFVGALFPIFRASRLDVDLHYNPPGIRGEPRYLEGVARFAKLHGSVDWVEHDGVIRRMGLPFGAEDLVPFLTGAGLQDANALNLMIYPNSAKDRETSEFPYVELFRDFATGICRPNSTLICYGYSFGDDHINRVIEDMLTIPSTHLVVISYGDPLGKIMGTYEKLGRGDQISLLLGNHLGDLVPLVDRYLPKSAIDRTTIRMTEILRARLDSGSNATAAAGHSTLNEEPVTP